MDGNKKHLSGCEKRKRDASKKLDAAGKDPKQPKLDFSRQKGKAAQDSTSSEPSTASSDQRDNQESSSERPNISAVVSILDNNGNDGNHEMVDTSRAARNEINRELVVVDNQEDQNISFTFLGPNPSILEKLSFVNRHPIQPEKSEVRNLNADTSKIYYRELPCISGEQREQRVRRKWITARVVNNELVAFYCSICLAFGSNPHCNFVKGVDSRITQRVHEHEKTVSHVECVNAYLAASNRKDLHHLLNEDAMTLRRKQVEANLAVLHIIFDVIKMIGRQGLAYRGHGTNESLYNLRNPCLNHGNFLEIIKTFSEHNELLQNHLDLAIQKSKERKERQDERNEISKGRGGLVTFLSKTFVNKIIDAILKEMRFMMVTEIGDKRYSVQMDSTSDITAMDQVAIVLRYLPSSSVNERLFAVVNARSSTGNYFFFYINKNDD